MEWIYNTHKITKLPEEVIGFVYCIYYTDGTKYIGKKLAKSERRKKPLKGMRVNAKRMVMTEHKWRDYEGSSKLTDDLTIQTKVITHLCTNKRSMSYIEVKELMLNEALESDKYMNNNISGTYFDNCLDGLYTGVVPEHCLFKGEY